MTLGGSRQPPRGPLRQAHRPAERREHDLGAFFLRALRDGERDRRVVEHAGDEDALLREQHGVFGRSPSERGVGVLPARLLVALRRQHLERIAQHAAGLSGIDDRVDEAELGGPVRVVERRFVLGDETGLFGHALALGSSARSRLPLRICTAGGAPITAISAVGHATQRSLPMPRESMTMYAPPYALRMTTQSRGTVAAE